MPAKKETLTRRQREIYDFVCDFLAARGHSPTVFDIAKHFKLRATSTVTEHLQSLERAGVIVRGKKGKLVRLPETERAPEMVQIPFYGRIAAGAPIEAINDASEAVYVAPELAGGDCYALRARGDSMMEDGILDGDLLIVRHCLQAEQGETVVALIDHTAATVKKFYRRGDRVTLEPANRRMGPIRLRASQVEVQGIVQAVIRRY